MITMPDLGVSAARNRGLEQAKGAYIMFVDADDRLRPGVLKSLHRLLCRTGSDMAGCSFAAWGVGTASDGGRNAGGADRCGHRKKI